MSIAPSINFDREYRWEDGKTPLDANNLNARFLSLHNRLKRMEDITYTFDGISAELAALGIARVNALVAPLIDSAGDSLASIGDILVEAQQKLAELQAEGITAGNVTLESGDTVEEAFASIAGDIAALVLDIAAAQAAIAAVNVDPVNFVTVTESLALVARRQYRLRAASGSIVLTLPASPASGASIRIVDGNTVGSGPAYTIARNGQTIMTYAEDFSVDVAGADFTIWFNGSDWRIS